MTNNGDNEEKWIGDNEESFLLDQYKTALRRLEETTQALLDFYKAERDSRYGI